MPLPAAMVAAAPLLVGAAIDLRVGEPTALHPVAWMGKRG